MQQKERRNMNRRDFMKGSIVAAGTTFCLSVGLREAVANAKATGAPVLTAANLNQKFAAARAARTLSAMVKEMKYDIPLWLRRNFSMTDLQVRAVKSIPYTSWTEIKRVLTFVETKRYAALTVGIDDELSTRPAAMGCRVRVKVKAEAEVDGVYTSASASAEATAQ